jgi:hypothetical protein
VVGEGAGRKPRQTLSTTDRKEHTMTRSIRTHGLTSLTALTAIGALAATLAMPAAAQEASPDTWIAAAAQTKTRVQVQVELDAARASGLLDAWQPGYIQPLQSVLTREAVRTATRQSIASGELAAFNAEAHGSPAVAALAAPSLRIAAARASVRN